MHVRRWIPLLTVLTLALAGALFSLVGHGAAISAPPPQMGQQTVVPTLPPESGLSWDVRDADTGAPIPCKLTLLGVDGTPTPAFTKNDIGRQESDAVAAYNRVMAATGLGVARVPHGSYDVYVSRGPEWDLFVARRVKVGAGGARVTARLKHVVNTSGWITADLHVHASPSSDSHVPMHDRIYEFLSDNVEMIVSTDHNVVSDYAPLINELGVGKEINSITGDELTTGSWGHFGAFPLPHGIEHAGHGAVHISGKDPVGFFKGVRELNPDAVIDVHHPRIDSEIGYFNLAHFDALKDVAQRPGFSYDFDAVEVLNGYQDSERRSVDKVIADWYWLLDHGHLVTATGNSDTHHLTMNIGGYPRNYVRVMQDRPSEVTPAMLARAIKHHRSFFSTAPFVTLRVDGVEIGDTAVVRKGTAKVELEVQAAPWVSVSRAIVILSGKEVKRFVVPSSTDVVRLKESFDLPLSSDGWVVARVEGDQPLSPIVGDTKRFDVRPFALTNPVFIDVNGNGVYDPPQASPNARRPNF